MPGDGRFGVAPAEIFQPAGVVVHGQFGVEKWGNRFLPL
jgi:hypothetical protein